MKIKFASLLGISLVLLCLNSCTKDKVLSPLLSKSSTSIEDLDLSEHNRKLLRQFVEGELVPIDEIEARNISFPQNLLPTKYQNSLEFTDVNHVKAYLGAIYTLQDNWDYTHESQHEGTPLEFANLGDMALNALDSLTNFHSMRRDYEQQQWSNFDFRDNLINYLGDPEMQSVLDQNNMIVINNHVYKIFNPSQFVVAEKTIYDSLMNRTYAYEVDGDWANCRKREFRIKDGVLFRVKENQDFDNTTCSFPIDPNDFPFGDDPNPDCNFSLSSSVADNVDSTYNKVTITNELTLFTGNASTSCSSVSYDINWGDGTSTTTSNSTATHTYPSVTDSCDIYTISVTASLSSSCEDCALFTPIVSTQSVEICNEVESRSCAPLVIIDRIEEGVNGAFNTVRIEGHYESYDSDLMIYLPCDAIYDIYWGDGNTTTTFVGSSFTEVHTYNTSLLVEGCINATIDIIGQNFDQCGDCGGGALAATFTKVRLCEDDDPCNFNNIFKENSEIFVRSNGDEIKLELEVGQRTGVKPLSFRREIFSKLKYFERDGNDFKNRKPPVDMYTNVGGLYYDYSTCDNETSFSKSKEGDKRRLKASHSPNSDFGTRTKQAPVGALGEIEFSPSEKFSVIVSLIEL